MREHLLPAHLHRRHDGALDPHVMSCDGSVPRCKALNLSSKCHLPTNAYWRATPRLARRLQPSIGRGRTKQDATRRKRKTGTTRAHELGLRWYLDPCARGWAVRLGRGAFGSSSGRLLLWKPRYVFSGVLPCDVGSGRETHRHDYTRLPAALSDELGGLSTSLGLSASPPSILSTESVVLMEWKGMSTAVARMQPGRPLSGPQ